MNPTGSRWGIATLRSAVRRWRRRLRRFRLGFLAVAGGLVTVISATYGDMPAGWRFASLVSMGLLTAVWVLVTEAPSVDQAQQRRPVQGRPQPAPPAGSTNPSSRPVARRRWLPRRPRWRTVPVLPSGHDRFQGRERELADLRRWHDGRRHIRGAGRPGRRRRPAHQPGAAPALGPVLLLVHGKPGVGKSALAQELARQLSPQYPDGQVFANLGTGGAARTPGEILQEFLRALGWSEQEMPAETVERAAVFRSLTAGKRMLFLLDAARHADQVRHVLPSDPAATVIVTSRRDLSADPDLNWSPPYGSPSYLLEPPDEDEALTLFRGLSGTDDPDRPECAVRVVQACDRLPAAIRSAAERVSQQGADICNVADLLQPRGSRLTWLEQPGRPVGTLIRSEYERLLPEEQHAFAMLGLLPSPTFVPWVLTPMLDVSAAQAEALVDRLSAVQLLDNLGRDEPSKLARYRLSGLVRLFAQERAEQLPEPARRAALARLTEAYREVVGAVLAVLHDDFTAGPARWLGADSELPRGIAARPEHWVRVEHPNLLRVLDAAFQAGEFALAWRVGAWLGGCVPLEPEVPATLRAYEQALAAAGQAGSRLGRIDVLLANGTFLAALERCGRAEECLEQAAAEAAALRTDPDRDLARAAARREAVAYRKRGEILFQAASYGPAIKLLERAEELARAAGAEDERRLIEIMTAEINAVDRPEPSDEPEFDRSLADTSRFRILLARAEPARRRGEWERAAGQLRQARAVMDGDLRRRAVIEHRLGRLYLDRALAGSQPTGRRSAGADPRWAVLAIRRAADAAVSFRQMGNPVGVLRAHCLLVHALLAVGQVVEAEQVAQAAEAELAGLDGSAGPASVPLAARVKRARGALLLHAGQIEQARPVLEAAAAEFGAEHDWRARQELLSWLSRHQDPGPVG